MIKLKVSWDKKAIQAFFLRQAEKIVFAGAAVCFLLLFYGAVVRPTFPSSPEKLIDAANLAKEHVERTPGEIELQVVDYPSIARRSRVQIKENSYAHSAVWNPTLFPPRRKRTEPKSYPVQALLGTAGFGAFSMNPSAAGEGSQSGSGTQGQRWVVLTALVPVAEQIEAFHECFKDAQYRKTETDVPKYISCRVERAVADSLTDDANLQWQELDLREALAVQGRWNGTAQEVVAAEFLNDGTVFPLGPRVDRPWDATVAHPPEIPLLAQPTREDAATTAAAVRSDQPAPAAATETAAAERAPITSLRLGVAARAASGPTPGGAAGPASRPDLEAKGPGAPSEKKYLLFRFFDFTVEPGKQYRYRVRLLLSNPNYAIDPRFLQDADLAKKEWIESQWSEPTAAVPVPREDRILVRSVQRPVRAGAEPTVTVLAWKWIADRGREVAEEFKISRGQLANFPERELKETVSAERRGSEDTDLAGASEPEPAGAKTAKTTGPRISYQTDMLLLDIKGGDRLRNLRNPSEPGEILLLDRDGTLVVQNQLDDEEDCTRLAAKQPKLAEKSPRTTPKARGRETEEATDSEDEASPAAKKPKKTTAAEKRARPVRAAGAGDEP